MLSSYPWSHCGDLLGDEFATDAYVRWAELMHQNSGLCIDTGSAAGRFSFELAMASGGGPLYTRIGGATALAGS